MPKLRKFVAVTAMTSVSHTQKGRTLESRMYDSLPHPGQMIRFEPSAKVTAYDIFIEILEIPNYHTHFHFPKSVELLTFLPFQ